MAAPGAAAPVIPLYQSPRFQRPPVTSVHPPQPILIKILYKKKSLTVETAAPCNYQSAKCAIIKIQIAKLSKLDATIKHHTNFWQPRFKGYVATAVKQVITRIVLQLLHEQLPRVHACNLNKTSTSLVRAYASRNLRRSCDLEDRRKERSSSSREEAARF